MKIFLDTSFFIAYFIKQEISHQKVTSKYKFYRRQKAIFFTSDYILDELLTWFSYHQTKAILGKLSHNLSRLEQAGEIKILAVDKTVCKKAREILLKFAKHKISFTDATSDVIMKEFSFNEIFTLDSDFRKMGLNTSF